MGSIFSSRKIHFGRNRGLETLNLRFNLLTGSVPDEIFNISSLRVIDLAANDFCGSLPLDICSSYVHKLEGIYLFLNRFEGEIPSSVSKCKKLQNFLSGLIPFGIFNISTIVEIVLSSNHFSGNLPSSMGIWLPNLQRLILYNNKLIGSIPNSISNAS
ncbi:hypothetical protein LguiA_004595 [Lonicera macranthoides]